MYDLRRTENIHGKIFILFLYLLKSSVCDELYCTFLHLEEFLEQSLYTFLFYLEKDNFITFLRTIGTFIEIFYVKLPFEHNTRFEDRKIFVNLYLYSNAEFLYKIYVLYSVRNVFGSSHFKKKDFVRVLFVESTT